MDMNRMILILVIAAAVGAIVLACGQREQQGVKNDPPTCGGPGIGIDHETIEANSLPAVETIVDHVFFTAAMPQGWQVVQTNYDGVNLLKGTIDEDSIKGPFMIISVNKIKRKTAAGRISELVRGYHATVGDDVTIVGRIYKTCTFTHDGYDYQTLVRDQDGWLFAYHLLNTRADDPEVRAIIHSLQLK